MFLNARTVVLNLAATLTLFGTAGCSVMNMDHAKMDHAIHTQTAVTEEAAQPADPHAGHTTTDHSAHADPDLPFDGQFIDGMIVHHQGAVDMANQVLAESDRPELLELATAIITAQEAEITQMQAWRVQWYPDLPTTTGMDMHMGDMEISTDAGIPFDQRFLTAMISHHLGAVDMARMALEMSEREEIRTLATVIIADQEAEIAQMRAWLLEWFAVELP